MPPVPGCFSFAANTAGYKIPRPPRSDPRSGEAVVLRREVVRAFRGFRQGANVKGKVKFLIERREKVGRRLPIVAV